MNASLFLRLSIVLSSLAFVASPLVRADEAPAEEDDGVSLTPAQRENRETVASEFKARQALFGGNADRLVRPGLLAYRDDRLVEITVEATGIAPKAILEFLLVGEGSGHEYEALFTSLASAADIDAALRFLGMEPGRNAFSDPLSFWPRGERVRAVLRLAGRKGEGATVVERPLEQLVLDAGTSGTLAETGFVYCGSRPDRDSKGALQADTYGPRSVLSVYNEPTTLLDVPRRAQQNEVYETYLANPDPSMKKHALLRVVLRPEPRPDGKPRVRDVTLAIRADGDGAPRFRWDDGNGPAKEGLSLGELKETWAGLSGEHDFFVTLDWGDEVPLGAAVSFAEVLSAVDTELGVRVEAPKPGQLYYRAFLPQPEWTDRAKRPSQPLELHLSAGAGGTVSAHLTDLREIWPEDGSSLTPKIEAQDIPVPSPGDLASLAEGKGNNVPALLVYAPRTLSLGAVKPYLDAVRETRPLVYFFPDGDSPAVPAP